MNMFTLSDAEQSRATYILPAGSNTSHKGVDIGGRQNDLTLYKAQIYIQNIDRYTVYLWYLNCMRKGVLTGKKCFEKLGGREAKLLNRLQHFGLTIQKGAFLK